MYLSNITINPVEIPRHELQELLVQHRAWYTEQAQKGNFVLVGPYRDRPMTGVAIATVGSREEGNAIIEQDAFYPDNATYDIHEFTANIISDDITQYQGK